jgi:isocitrate lyase
MLAYVDLIQRRERELGVDVLTHQKWSGASYIDRVLGSEWIVVIFLSATSYLPHKTAAVQAGSSATAASGADSTEGTFH